jgi:hypothetical protein
VIETKIIAVSLNLDHVCSGGSSYFWTSLLFSEFCKLMNEVENEDLVFTLETIVDKFGEEMAPYAIGLCENLVCYVFISQR